MSHISLGLVRQDGQYLDLLTAIVTRDLDHLRLNSQASGSVKFVCTSIGRRGDRQQGGQQRPSVSCGRDHHVQLKRWEDCRSNSAIGLSPEEGNPIADYILSDWPLDRQCQP